LRSVALWGPGEDALADEVVARSEGAAFRSPAATIADLVAMARGAAVFVSGDTGPAHIASAVATPSVGIFGPTRPSRNGPLGAEDLSVSRADVCRCHHLRRCTEARMCVLDIEVDEVVDAIDRRLMSAGADHHG
jgi:heptosyltransferase-1